MAHPILFALFAFFLVRAVARRRAWALAAAHHCRYEGRHGDHGVIYQGTNHRYSYPPDRWARRRRWGRADAPAPGSATTDAPVTNLQRLDAAVKALDLNQRQRAEVSESLDTLRSALGTRFEGWQHLGKTLNAIAAPDFNRAAAETAIAADVDPARWDDTLDALEHVHNVLTDEQRAALGRFTTL